MKTVLPCNQKITYAGRIEAIRNDPSSGKTQADRDRKAEDYKTEILGLVDEGLELCQAKLVMDMRKDDDEAKPHMLVSYMKQGMSAADARCQSK